ncbi:uncharacterized protein LOC131281288 [Anopheles ziemanni]|uniref:uncharacterized protein LOC131265492 n=1 Tax=Anopheles coustani TaxID=139045 RepID=UPI00265A7863|nr:uncharacterized protein LOC131265492 [Anopheles coustani]XP_058166548.1 uncharacterized protein LOC131281288 [Anopheles ziemanni]
MRGFICLALLSVAISVVAADRGEALQLFSDLKRSKKSRGLGRSDDFVSVVQSELLLAEEEYVRSSINGESGVLEALSEDAAQTSGPACVDFIKQKAAIMMNLAGVSYATCLRVVDDEVFAALSTATDGAVSRDQYDEANVLSAFRGENIFVDPSRIRGKLQQRMRGSFRLPALDAAKIAVVKTELEAVKDRFIKCMKTARGGLDDTLKATSKQLKLVCANERE